MTPMRRATIATVRQIFVYPVKSMRGVPVHEVYVGLNGIHGDRRYAFVQKRIAAADSFPWMTGRQQPRMITYQPAFARRPTAHDDEPPVTVRLPDGDELDVADPRLRERLEADAGCELFLVNNARGNYDSQHLSIFNLLTLRALELESDSQIDLRQFRANFYIEELDGMPFGEEDWPGYVLQIGEAVVAVTKKDTRCMMINLEPDTGAQHPEVLRTVTRLHNQQAGVYANVLKPGIVRAGDPICVLDMMTVNGDAG